MLFGQKIEPVLRAVQKTFAKNLARADGDLRLNDVIAGAERVAVGIEKGQNAIALILFEKSARETGWSYIDYFAKFGPNAPGPYDSDLQDANLRSKGLKHWGEFLGPPSKAGLQ